MNLRHTNIPCKVQNLHPANSGATLILLITKSTDKTLGIQINTIYLEGQSTKGNHGHITRSYLEMGEHNNVMIIEEWLIKIHDTWQYFYIIIVMVGALLVYSLLHYDSYANQINFDQVSNFKCKMFK